MRGISEERLLNLRDHFDKDYSIAEAEVIQNLLNECQELQEPWMTLDEFLRSGFNGWCWINLNPITVAYKLNDNFYLTDNEVDLRVYKIDQITHVQPIHKPESPK